MANGTLEMPGMQVSGQQAADYMASPSGQLLEQERRFGQMQAMKELQDRQNRQSGLVTPQQQMPPGVTPGGFSGPGGAERLNEIYGIIAQGADKPAAVGEQYVQTMQRQQELDRKNQPIEQFLQLYGKVNPYDWSAPSLQRFHDNYIKTGQLQFDLLEPKKSLNAQETKAILDADERMYKAGTAIGRMGSLVDRLDTAVTAGNYTQGLVGTVDEWFSQNITGNVDDTNLLKQEFRELKNAEVISKLPPGVASDKDIAIAREGWPGPNVSPAYLAAFLRGMQKIRVLDFAYQRHRSHFIGTEETPQGLSQDWLDNRKAWISDAMANNGLTMYNPTNPDGTEMSNEQAARYFYARQGVGQQPALVRAGAPTAPAPAAGAPAAGAQRLPQAPGAAMERKEVDILQQYGIPD